jgi:hypothetical protein
MSGTVRNFINNELWWVFVLTPKIKHVRKRIRSISLNTAFIPPLAAVYF